ncbi:hypothetical protein BCU85_00470 [Vibrio lentus]|uniref:hypothetical protein n=1 Tax=Vibrio lentus TaxID=136468 RepID=UPI000C858DD9|nr:hypothetical protein [Vibrio lentus]MCC4815005.1 hypothetical protein [Vibrio lentus]PMG74657.1 hypothetical protein BCU85_00470 [Vibrio lentus]PMK88610.1 hypothetical protein BCT88_10170 [Vibrio lentus]PML26713.1 hypothetical protein BCT80_05270 [Vibrio lentus]PMM28838.1 hypothetical protein BCT57_04760 [Vibrio lentus]
MDSRIQLNLIKYVFSELSFIAVALALVYWLSGGDHSLLQTIGLIYCVAAAAKILTLWWQFRVSSFEISGGHLRFNGFACDIALKSSFLPRQIGSVVKLSYTVDTMQKRNIYLPKCVLSPENWTLILKLRT